MSDQRCRINPIWDGGTSKVASVNSNLWGLDQMGITKIWTKYITRGVGANVYVIDSGVHANHHQFLHRGVRHLSFVDGKDGLDENGHGTWVCGRIGAMGVGIAPECNLHSLRSLDKDGSGYIHWTTEALEHVFEQGDAHIVNLSLGTSHYDSKQSVICQRLYDQGVIVVAAAGNENTNAPSYPAAYDGVLAVAAFDKNEDRAWFSNFGQHVEISAPGVSVYGAYLNRTFRRLSGTSMAAPTVAGLLALGVSYVKSRGSVSKVDLRDMIVDSLLETAKDLGESGKDDFYGHGAIDGIRFMETLKRKTA